MSEHIYSITNATWTRPNGTVYTDFYSGGGTDPATAAQYRNNPADVGDKNLGPLPPGIYTILRAVPIGPGHTGRFVLGLVPDDATRAYIQSLGRGPDSFFLHGDSPDHLASDGCVVAENYYERYAIDQDVAAGLDQLRVTS